MRAWRFFRQLVPLKLAALLAAPAYSFEKTLPAIPLQGQASAGVYPKTRVWGSDEKILLHFRGGEQLSENGAGVARTWKTVLGSGVTYDYDALGNLIHSSTTLSSPTPNELLFAGEQFEPDLNLYYNRARYLNVSTGRFWTMDTDEAPLSLDKYLSRASR